MEVDKSKYIKYYFLKLLWKKFKNWETLKNFCKKDDELKNIFESIIDSKDTQYLFCQPCLMICEEKKDNFDYNYLLFQKDLNSEDNKRKFFNLFLKNNNYEYLYVFLSNIIIIYHSCLEKTEKKNCFESLLVSIVKFLDEI